MGVRVEGLERGVEGPDLEHRHAGASEDRYPGQDRLERRHDVERHEDRAAERLPADVVHRREDEQHKPHEAEERELAAASRRGEEREAGRIPVSHALGGPLQMIHQERFAAASVNLELAKSLDELAEIPHERILRRPTALQLAHGT